MKVRKRKKLKKMVFLIIPILLAYIVATGYFIKTIYYYNASESFMKYVVFIIMAISLLSILLFIIFGIKALAKNKAKRYIVFLLLIILFGVLEIFISYNIGKVSGSISKITDKYTTYSSSLIVLKDSKINSISSLSNKKIGIISNKTNTEGYIIPMLIVKEKKINKTNLVYYDEFEEMLTDLYDNKIDAVFVSSSYKTLFANTTGFENITNEVKVIAKKDKIIKKSTSSSKTLTEPFTVLVMGVDSESESLSSSSSLNGDALILMTFNPKTMNATILSIPRDTYVPIACYKNNAKNKINAASYGGAECMINTIENLTKIKIDYWVKVNFKGVVKLVNALDGVNVNVPYAFCEQDSNRRFGKYTIFVEKGQQTLNGEQALAFARNRHTWPQICGKKYSNYTSNDFIRGQNQQLIINAILNKAKSINSLSKVYQILDVVGNNIDTNIDKQTMITGFDTFKKMLSISKNINSTDFVGTQRLYLSGYDMYLNNIYYYAYYKQSLTEVTDAMKINLGLEDPTMDKEFDFSINKTYESTQIGKGIYKY